MNVEVINISTVGTNGDGELSFFEAQKDIPFDIKRIYYIYDVLVGSIRGNHAHKNLEQLLFCPNGEVKITVFDGTTEESYLLNSPDKGLYIGNGVWRTMEWLKEESVLCVAASKHYDEDDYIRNYNEFLKHVEEEFWDNGN